MSEADQLTPEAREAYDAVHSAMLQQDLYHLEVAKAVRIYCRVLEWLCLQPFSKEDLSKKGDYIGGPYSRPIPPDRSHMTWRVVEVSDILRLIGPEALKHLPTCEKLGLLVGVKLSGLTNLTGIELRERYAVVRPADLVLASFGAPVEGLIP